MDPPNPITTILIFGTLGMGILAGAIILFVVIYQKRMLQQKAELQQKELQFQKNLLIATINTQEEERKRIARDLHDDLAGDLSTLRLSINRLPKQITNPESFSTSANQSKALLDDSINKVRNIARTLMPPTLQKLGLARSLKDLCKRLEVASGISIEFIENGKLEDLPEEISLGLYRVTQELLNNSLKHSKANAIKISLKASPILLTIEDNGVGFNLETERKKSIHAGGMGLKSMESRLEMIGAKIEMESLINQGTKASISLLNSIQPTEP